MKLKDLIRHYLNNARLMQLATSVDSQPWVCTVHFYSDKNLNFYWMSTLARRHSKEIEQNKKVAIAILIHEDNPKEEYVIGISAEGNARLISRGKTEKIGSEYIKKLDKDPDLLKDILEDRNPHRFFCLKPSKIVLFDSKSFPDNPRQELNL